MAISNSRSIALDERGVTFKWKDYRVKEIANEGGKGKTRHRTMMLDANEFMRRILVHVLLGGFHRIWHHGLLAKGNRKASLALARAFLDPPLDAPITSSAPPRRRPRQAKLRLRALWRGQIDAD